MKKFVTIIKPNGKRLVTAIDKNFVLKDGDKMECEMCIEVPEVKEEVKKEEKEESVVQKAIRRVKKSTKKK